MNNKGQLDDIVNNPAFWILGGGGVAMELVGWIMGKRMGLGSFPIWQLFILIIGTLIAAAIFANRD